MAYISACETVAESDSFMFAAAASIWLPVTAGGMLPGPKAQSADLFHFNSWPKSLLAVYRVSAILQPDPIVRWALASGAPITWIDLAGRPPRGDPGRELFILAARHAYKEGLT